MSNYNIKELRGKLDRCKNMDLKDVNLDEVVVNFIFFCYNNEV